jgi:hypothetical protein
MLKKIDNYFFYENNIHYINTMTGHSINAQQSQEFLLTMHTMIDDLDTISSHIDEHTYLRLVNGLQRLYNIHNTGTQTSSPNYETLNRTTVQTNNEVQINRMLARHYGRVYDISGILISNEPYPINNDIDTNALNNYHVEPNVINANPNIVNSNPNVITVDANAIINENNEAHNRENARISYAALYGNAFDYWNQVRFQRTN